MDGREIDEGFTTGSLAIILFRELPITTKPGKCSFNHPAFRNHCEATLPGWGLLWRCQGWAGLARDTPTPPEIRVSKTGIAHSLTIGKSYENAYWVSGIRRIILLKLSNRQRIQKQQQFSTIRRSNAPVVTTPRSQCIPDGVAVGMCG
jgi:hypothetical protein